jgi:peptide/nickel transport system substrate-binding protein
MKRLLMPMLAAIIIVAMVVPGCGEPTPPGTYALTIAVNPVGAGTAEFTGTSPFEALVKVPVQAAPEPGFEFITWTASAGFFDDPSAATTNFNMPAQAATITANFGVTVPPTGAMVGELVFSEEKSPTATVTKIAGGTVDLYAQPGIVSADVFNAILAAGLPYQMSYGSYRDIRYNPSGPTFGPGSDLNPFSVPEIREAMMWLIDREYVVGEYLGGLGAPIYVMAAAQFPESAERYPDIVSDLNDYYAPKTPAEVWAIIEPHMLALGATWNAVTEKWEYAGSPVALKFLIRSDLRPFPGAGDYVADRMEDIGFTTVRDYKTGGEAGPIWLFGNPADGAWHVYTGGWGIPTIPRDQASTFAGMQTASWYAVPLYLAYEAQIVGWDDGWPGATETYYELIIRLFNRQFSSLAEREEMFERAMVGWGKFSAANLLVDLAAATPYGFDVNLLVNLAYGPGEGWTRALSFNSGGVPVWGDRMDIEMESLLIQPWNPVDGSNWVYDLTINRDAMNESGLIQDPVSGLYHPNRIASAEVTIGNNLPVAFDGPAPAWLSLTVQAGTIPVPDDAWAEWDASTGTWKTAIERFPGGATALRKSVVTYPADIFDFPMHDGSTLSMADFLMAMILPLDIAQPASPIHEPARIAAYNAFMTSFRGYRITSVDPLTVEFYSNSWFLDPEWNVATLFPAWKQGGSNPWHMISIGWLASRDAALRFGSAKAAADALTWMDYTKGPSLPILATRLTNAQNSGHADYRFIPYRAAIEEVYTDFAALGGAAGLNAEIDARYGNLQDWYTDKEHFWVDMGLYYLDEVFPIAKNIVLKRFEDHPDPSDRWLWLLP